MSSGSTKLSHKRYELPAKKRSIRWLLSIRGAQSSDCLPVVLQVRAESSIDGDFQLAFQREPEVQLASMYSGSTDVPSPCPARDP